MTITYITATQTTAATMDGSDQLFVLGSLLGSGLANAVEATGSNNDIIVGGTIANASGRGILLEGGSSTVTVSEGGSIFQASTFGGSALFLNNGDGFHDVYNYGQISGNYGVATSGSSINNEIFNYGTITGTEDTSNIGGVTFFSTGNKLYNEGQIIGGNAGVSITATGDNSDIYNLGSIAGSYGIQMAADDGFVTNHGTITGSSLYGILMSGTLGSEVVNYGTIVGTIAGVFMGSTDSDTLRNYGLIENSVVTNGFDKVVVNGGTIDGEVAFGGGNDTYIGNGTGSTTGGIYGGDGEDDLKGAGLSDTLFGGGGNDKLHGRGDDDTLNGNAGNDTILGAAGDDTIFGGSGADDLRGGNGDDVIEGGAKTDSILGGRGDDTLTGGADIDTFVFHKSSGFDTITDFENNVDLIDLRAFGLNGVGDLNAVGAISTVGTSVVVSLSLVGGDGELTIENLTINQLNNPDFIF